MTTRDFIASLAERQIELFVSGGQLRFRAPDAALTEEIRAQIRERRAALIELLSADSSGLPHSPNSPDLSPQPLSEGQAALWFLHQLEPRSTAYNTLYAAHLAANVDTGALQLALDAVHARHELLRGRFGAADGKPFVNVDRASTAPLEIVDAAGWTGDAIDRFIAARADEPFDLEHGPVARWHLLTGATKNGTSGAILALVAHHVVVDFRSLEVLLRDVTDAYLSIAAGGRQPLPDLAGRYRDYVRRQQQWIRSERGLAAQSWWTTQLAAPLPVLDLPTDFGRPATQDYSGHTLIGELDAGLTARVKQFAKDHLVTPNSVLLGAFSLLLSRYCRQDELLIGVPMLGRTGADEQEVVGYFVNPVVLRLTTNAFADAVAHVQSVHRANLDAMTHQAYPFPRLVDDLNIARDASRSPLFQVAFVYERESGTPIEERGLFEGVVSGGQRGAVFDVTLTALERAGAFRLTWEYATALFRPETIERLSSQFRQLVSELVSRPREEVRRLSILSDDDAALVARWNGAGCETPVVATLADRFAAQLAKTPDLIAVETPSMRWTYAELDARANEIAVQLLTQGVTVNVPVAVALQRGPEMIAAVVAVMKTGGACVPIDTTHPRERVRFMLQQSSAAVLIADATTVDRLPEHTSTLVRIEEIAKSQGRTSVPACPAGPDDLLYVMYTSGSTGQPKGVAVPHRTLVNLLDWQMAQPGLDRPARTLQYAPLTFDASYHEIATALCSGGSLLPIDDESRRDSRLLVEWIARHQVERLFIPFVALQHLAEAAPAGLPACLRDIITAGEQLRITPAIVSSFGLSGTRLHNHYGPTESHVVTAWPLPERVTEWEALPPIGPPIANTQMHVLGPHGEAQPIGVPGELWIGGVALAIGYLNRPDLTAERFIEHPRYGRIYKTGDVGRWRDDGALEYLGRTDHQVKLRGFRVELEEIETVMSAHPAVREAAVTLIGEGESKALAGFIGVGPHSSAREVREQVLQHLREHLPDYMVPARITVREQLPQTSSGKIDRGSLAALPADEEPDEAAQSAARTETERTLQAIWSSLLGVERPGVRASFFDLGGHSLRAARLVARIRTSLAVDVPLRAVFENPTIHALALRVDALRDGEVLPPLEPAPADAPLQLSFGQQRLWLLDQLEGPSATYSIPAALQLEGPLQVDALRRAFAAIVARHAGLRLVFPAIGGQPQVRIVEPYDPLAVTDLSALEPRARQTEADRLQRQHAAQPFDLARGPLLRAHVLRLTEESHLLLFGMHHIISDGWSLGVLLDELRAFYEADVLGRVADVRPLTVQYPDYAAWQRQWLRGDVLDRQLAYWTTQLTGAPPLLELPADYPRPAQQRYRGGIHRQQVSRATVQRLRRFNVTHESTPFMTLLSVFQLLLSQHSGQDEVCVGTPVANRRLDATEGLIGFFVNTLVMRARIDPAASFDALLAAVRATSLDAFTHQDLPFELLVDALQPQRSLSHSPLFQALFVMVDASALRLGLKDVSERLLPASLAASKFDLTLYVEEHGDDAELTWEYDADLFAPERIARMAGHFAELLGGVLAAPEAALAMLRMLTPPEQLQITEWGRGPSVQREWPSVMAAVAAQVHRAPDRIALACGQTRVTYRELNARANRIARFLQTEGIGRGQVVAICLPRGVDMVASVLGTLKAGAAYLPLDPAYPPARLGFILDDAGAAMVISDSSIASVADARPARACWIDRDAARIAAFSGEDLPDAPAADDLIYVIYTSGSTGQPKGAAVRHGGFANLVQWYIDELKLGDADRVLLISALGFDLTQKNLFAPLIAGGTLCLPQSETYDPAALRAEIEAQQITWVNCTPSAFYPLVDRHDASVWRSLATLRWVVLGGEPIDVSRLRPWLTAAAGRARVLNSYGPTECTDICLVWAFDGQTRDEVIPLGRPIPNMRLAVLDTAGRPVPVGLPGELWIGGAGVGAGYLHRPELNAAAFRDVTVFGETLRMYRSGDRVRWRPDGVLDYLGRGDHQIKLRGFRIELGEIESALRSVPGVAEAVAMVRERDGHAALVAYVVAAESATTAVILQQAVAALPAYMVPSQVVRLARMPLTPHGKVDRLGLPDPDEQPSSPVDVPVTATETQLARTWGELLGLTAIGRHADFFASGGHSLLATRLVARIADEFGVELPLRSLFEHPTLAGVAAVIDERQTPLRPAIAPRPSDEPAVLSFAQERLWFLDQLEPGGTAYSIPAALDLRGALDVPALTRALADLVARHDILRLRIVSQGGTPSPRLLPPYDPLTTEDVGGASDPQAEADRIGREYAGRPFDLESGPLFRSHLVTLGPERHRLLFNLHHITSDGWSVDLLIRDLAALYAGHRQGKAADLPALPLRYTDYSRWQREQVGARAAEQLAYWREQLRDAPERLELPIDFPRTGLRQHQGGEVHLSIDPALAARLEALARAEGGTLFMGLLAAFSVLLYRASAQKDICIGTPVAYRPSLELEHVAGLFLNTLVVRTRIAAGASFLDVLADARKSALGAYANQDVPFEYLVEQLQPQRSLNHTPLFQVMLNLVNTRTEPPRLDGMEVTQVSGSLGLLAKFDLSLSLTVLDDGGLDGRLEYNAGLFAGETVAFLAECFQTLLRQVVEHPDRPLARTSMLAASTPSAAMAPTPTGPVVDFGSIERSIPSRFAEQVRATPDAVAVCTPAARVTYRELDQRARRVAAALMATATGRAVALLLPHDAAMAIGMLGTLQSGRMYVPLDASHPIERLLQIAADAEISAVVSCAALDPLARKIAGASCPVIDVDNPGAEAAEHLPAVSPDSIAYVLYTSGSTGTPKGVIQNHRNVLHFIREYTERLRIGSSDRVLQVASYAFDAAVMDLFGALLNGATLYPVDLKQQTVREACDWIAGQAITIYHSTPTVFRLLCEGLHPSTSLRAGREVPAVRLVVLGGEAATRGDFEAFQQRFGAGCLFVNGLGPTESTVTLQMFLDRDARLVRGSVPVGYPVGNTSILLVDADHEPTELCGEIVIRSPHVALGYWRRESTAFSDDPEHSGQRLYRTGDLARLLPDGSLEALGRRDGQIKLRGFRIELGEIESALRRHPAVTEAAVVLWPALDSDLPAGAERMLAAYVSGGVTPDELKAWLRDTLPDYMVPAGIAVLDRLPVTPNGKLDRRSLPAPLVDLPGSDDVALATDGERSLAELWSDVLARPVTDRTASFFDLGGHSLVAARLVARIRERLGVEAPLRLVFEQPVLHEQASALERYRTGSLRPAIEHRPQAPVTLTAAQQRLWFLAEREGAALGAAYTISAALGVDGAIDEAALRRALVTLTARHDGLRINVRNVDGSPSVTLREQYNPLQILTLSEAATGETLARMALAHAAAPFDLAMEPLLRLTLVRDPDQSPKALLFSIHHLIADGWSLSVLVQELATLYAGAPLAPLPITMADYAVWERQWLTGPERSRQLQYWRTQLADAPALLELPTDLPRPAVKSYRGAQTPVQLPADLVTKLRAVGQAEGATLAMTVQAGLVALLHRYSAATDIIVGSPIAQRPQRETEGLVGLLVNTVALRTPVTGTESFAALVRRVRQVALDAYGHADVPFDQLVEELQPARSLSYSPIYQVMCAVQTMPVAAVKLGEAVTRSLAVDRGTAKVDLLLSVGEEAGALAGVWEYRTDLWEAATIARLAQHFETLLEGAVRAPGAPVAQLPLLTPGEANALGQWSTATTAYPRDVGIHTLVAAQADERPDAVALIAGDTSVSYRELVTRARQLAGWLQAHGVAHETPVGVCLDRSANLIVSFLAILEAGGAYVPLDPGYPQERLAHLIADTGLSVVLATTATSGSLPMMPGVTVLCLDEAAGEIAAAPPPRPAAVTGASLAYLMYTSGSTGQPKGVAVPHRAIARLVLAQNYIAMKQDDVVLHHSSIAFDASTFEVWAPLLTGGKLVLCEERRPSLAELRRLIEMHTVTTVWLTSGLFTLAVDHALDALRGLRYLLAGGDVLSVPHVQRAVAALTHGTVINGYGPTENTTFSCCAPITNAELIRDTVPIGRPIANTEAYVLDEQRQLVPVGVPGELYVGGDGLARGYWRDEALTQARFVDVAGLGRLYRTGDRCRWRADGQLEFVGRVDTQVKLRGFRIEPGEIEAVLRREPGVRDAIVLVVGEADHRRLVAYVAGAASSVDVAILRGRLQQLLPAFMVPAQFVVLDELPLSANGKVDRSRLPAPPAPAASSSARPLTPTEEVLAGLWAEVLQTDVRDAHADFFALGGHSLMAMQVVARIRTTFGTEVPLATVFAAPSLAALAEAIATTSQSRRLPPITHQADAPLTLTAAQQRLWFLTEREGAALGSTYTIHAALGIDGDIDEPALRRALIAVTGRHDSLRVNVRNVSGAPEVTLREPYDPLIVATLTKAESRDVATSLAAHARTHGTAPFDLETDPLLRLTLMRDASGAARGLLFSIHHLIADGWSLSVLVQELAALYAGDSLPPLPVTMADYAVWEREWLAGPERTRQLDYWKTQLGDAPALLELPTDGPRPAVKGYAGAQVPVQLAPELVARLRAVGQAEGATLAMTVLAGLMALLHRYSGATDVVVGSPVAQRPQREAEGLIGLLVNTVALRAPVTGNESFAELVRTVRRVALEAYGHVDLPFDQLVEELQLRRSLSYSPVYQVMCAVQTAPTAPVTLGTAQTRSLAVDPGTAKVDLLLNVADEAGALVGVWEYRTDLWSGETIARLAQHFETLLAGAVAAPDTPVGQLPLLTTGEAGALMRWSGTPANYPCEASIPSLIAAQAARRPDAIALIDSAEAVSYGELVRRAHRLAGWLQAHGVRPETPVGVCLDRSTSMVVSLLGTLEAGGAYVPLDPAYPAERLAHLIGDTGLSIVLTTTAIASSLPDVPGLTVLCLDTASGELAAAPSPVPVATTGESLAYLMYTSGSTGPPKGVAVPHRAIARLVLAQNYAALDEDDVVLHHSSIAFDASTFEVWAPLLTGGRLVLCETRHPSLAELTALIETHGVTTLWLTSGLFSLAVDHALDALRGLRFLLAGGDVLSVPHVRRAVAALSRGTVINGYGPTENTTFSCCAPITNAALIHDTVPIGRPIANTTAYVLDARQQPAPIGVPGELYVGGDGLARGYWQDPALTRERFIDVVGLGRLYRTGDRCRWRADGQLEFLGRLDAQVKLRGFRVEPGEIEAVLRREPNVRDAVVLLVGEMEHRRIVAYAVGDATALDGQALRTSLLRQLPAFMVPAQMVVLDQLPLTANGKVDRARLPVPPEVETVAADREWTATELALAPLWTDVLRSVPGDPNADFFASGGNSLLAMQLVARVRAEFQVDVPIALIFETPGLGEIAAAIAASGGPREADSIPRLDAAADRPLSFAQERLWFLAQLEPDNPFYNSPLAIRIQGALDRDALAGALQDIVDRHDVLRTAFVGDRGRPRQVVRDVAPFVLAHETISLESNRSSPQDPRASIDSLIHERARREAATPFDLANPPLLRAVLLTLDANQHVLLLTMHHIVTDGWSLGVMTRELAHFYRVRQGEASTLAPLVVQYADFAAWQRQRLAGERFAQHLGYWRGQLAGAPPTLSLPADRVRPAVQQFRGGSIRFTIDDGTREGLHRIARERNATLFMTLLGAFATLLYRHSGQHDIVIGSPIANRQHQDLEPLLGFFVNTLALRVDLSGSPRFVDLLDRVQRLTLDGYAHQDLPFEKLVDELQPERDLSRSPLFQVMFALQNAPMDAVNVSGLQFSSLQIERRAALFDLVLDMWETPSGLTGVLEYNRDLFDHATAERMIRHLQALIGSIVADATTAIDAAVIVDDAEQRELLALSNGPRHDYPVDRSYAAAFEEQVASAPDREAAVDEHERVTYGELNARANRVAHALKDRGVGPGVPVAVFLPRGVEYLAAVLGVVKAGGVFVPVDVAYPAERVRHMLEDSSCPVVLSDGPRSVLLERLQSASSAAIVLTNALDGDESNPPIANGPRDALYMIYTSGSTGLPKGALVRHDGALNHIYAEFRLLDFTERSAFLQSAPASSDISVWQCLAPLLAGGRTVFASFDVMVSPPALLTLIQHERVTLIELVPAVLDALVSHAASLPEGAGALPELHHVMVTGEAAPVPLVNRCHAQWPRVPIVNAYGPTEAADDVCQGVVAAPLDASCTTVPIGVPIDNMSVMVLDANRQLAPIGVPGEIAVSGIGVGAGYWRQPERTAAAFVPNLHAELTFGDTIYRTGDLGRWRHDGSLEFIGRVDQQVKIRGFRVELGEIEAVIARHSSVRAAIVIDVEREPGDRQIVAYIQPESDAGTASNLMQEQVAGWKGLHDESYADDRVLAARPTFNTIGWDSTYTGEPLTDREMRECVANAVTRIRELRPARLLEIGCGTGLLLYRLAGRGFAYSGTDLSETAIRQLEDRQRQHSSHGLGEVRLMCRTADDFSGFKPGEFDAVALNSVVQYFPSAGYLQEVLRGAARVCDGRGAIFVGDVRSLPLLRSYYASVQVAKAAGSVTASRLAATINEHIAREQELLIAPRFFDEAARQLSNATARLQPKRGRVHNELTRFRYDVVLPVGDVKSIPASPADCWTDWRAEAWGLADIGRYLAEVRPQYWGLRHVANARLRDERGMLEWLAQAPPGATVTELREWLSAAGPRRRDVDPESIWQLAKRLPYRVDVVVEPDGEAGEFAVLFSHRDSVPVSARLAPADGPGAEWQPLTSNPLQEKLGRRVIPELREHLRETLPGHMIPQSIVVLDRFPLLPNGKVDRGSLPMPASDADRRTEHVAPRTPTEAVVHAVWSEVLGVQDPGAHDNFFALGGHSLKASQVISRLQQRGKQASLRDVFNHPTLAELATAIDRQQGVDPAQQIARTPLAADYPTSAAQRRLWVLAQIGGSAAYNMADAVRLRGQLDADALMRAFDGLLRRHESLRTSFIERDGELRQVVSDEAPAALAVVNLETEPDPLATARIRAVAHASALHDLSTAPLLRAELLRLNNSDHVLLVNMHHIVSDGWSMDVLIRDVMTLYDAAVRGASAPLLPLPIQHRDYVSWQEERLRDRRETDLRYWVERLRGAAPLDLPTDSPRPAEKTFAGARLQRRIPRRMGEQLSAFAQAEGVTPSMLLTALVKVLLHRHSGQSDISVGSPVAGRPHPQLEAQVGFFVNTLVLRDDVDGAMPFVEFLARVRETVTGALAHQDVPFDWVVNELKPARDASRNPLFDVMVAVQNTANESLRFAQVEASSLGLDYGVAQFDLLWSFTDSPDGLFLDLRYNADLFRPGTIDAIVDQWQTLAAGALARPSTPVARLPLIGAGERAQLTAIPDSFRESIVTGNLADAFDAQAARTPEAIALRDGDRSLTYADLQRWVTYAALGIRRELDAAGRGHGALLGICLHRSVEQVVAILATLKAGASYVPLDPDAPAARLAFIRQDAGVPFVVTHGRTAGITGGDELALPLPPKTGAESWQAPAIAANDPAYVIYTSGSTGEPKGVVVSHANVLRLFSSTSPWFGFGPSDVWTLFHSYAFDFSVWEIWGALLHGGRLVIVPYAVSRDPEECYRLISHEQVTVLNQTPSAFRQLLHSSAAQGNELPLALRYVIFGGEALQPSELAPWFERHGDRAPQLVNMYGITETTVHVTYRPLTAADALGTFSPIGEPIPDLYLQVLDPHQEPAPVGVPGELYVGGAGLANGYWQRDSLTSERFVPDPFHSGRRLYRTGDRVRIRRTGELEYLGRVDTQVKIRGHRVELGEIASVVARHPGVREAVVIARKVAEQTSPLAYYVPAGPAVEAQELRRHVQQALPDYMVPLAFTALAAIPLTVNGKLDEAALPSPVATPAVIGERRAPRTDAERRILEVWREALAQEALGPDDNVFDHGAHSVLAVLVRRRLEAALGRDIPVVSLFQYPTPAALALHLDPAAAPPPDADAAIDRAAARRQARRPRQRQ